MALADPGNTSLEVLMMPDYRQDNPYQCLLVDAVSAAGVKVRFPKGYRRLLPVFRAWLSIKSPILHLHWLEPYSGRGAAMLKWFYCAKLIVDLVLLRVAGVKLVWTVHNLLPHDTSTPGIDRWTQGGVARLAHRIILHSETAQKLFETAHGERWEKSVVIPHGHYQTWYPEKVNRQEARRLLGLPDGTLICLAFGMIRPYKGIHQLIEAWRQLPQDQDRLLIIAGEIGDPGLDQSIIDLLDETISYRPGRTPDDEVALLFSAADLAVYNFSRLLTSGSVMLALSYDLPVVAPAHPVLCELLGEDAPLLFEPGRTDSLVKKLTDALHSDLAAERSRARRVCAASDWDEIAERTVAVYNQLLERS